VWEQTKRNFVCFGDQVSLGSPGWPKVHNPPARNFNRNKNGDWCGLSLKGTCVGGLVSRVTMLTGIRTLKR
jgi:hypothetical protein